MWNFTRDNGLYEIYFPVQLGEFKGGKYPPPENSDTTDFDEKKKKNKKKHNY